MGRPSGAQHALGFLAAGSVPGGRMHLWQRPRACLWLAATAFSPLSPTSFSGAAPQLMFWLAAMMHGMTLARHALPVSLQPPAPSLGVARPANGKSSLSVDAAPIPAPLPAAASSADAPAGSPLEAGKLAGTGAGKAAAEGLEEDHGDEEDAAAAAAAAAGRLLVIDQPWRDQLRFHIMKIVIWVALEVLIILEGVKQVGPCCQCVARVVCHSF